MPSLVPIRIPRPLAPLDRPPRGVWATFRKGAPHSVVRVVRLVVALSLFPCPFSDIGAFRLTPFIKPLPRPPGHRSRTVS